MRRCVPFFALSAGILLFCPIPCWAADDHVRIDFPLWTVLPFVLLLLSIAILPLVAGHFWHSNLHKLYFSIGLSLPVIAYLIYLRLSTVPESLSLLGIVLLEYADFIALLGSLYTVSGGIVVEGHLRATPWTNVRFLAIGAVLANVVGTTGASMLLIRPYLRINRSRKHNSHLPIFFIFVVSNLGGLLTPLGDPPLFLGFLRGVEFFWTLSMWQHWLLVNGLVLLVFVVWDTIAWQREPAEAHAWPTTSKPLRLLGISNLVLLVGILVAVILQSPDTAAAATRLLRQHFPCPDLHLPRPWGAVAMVAMAALSLLRTPRSLRQLNEFTWEAMLEVAILFLGIFVTMIPALEILQLRGHSLGIEAPWQYFWLTGLLSAFLDNAPTYLTFATVAAEGPRLDLLMANNPLVLQAISCGAVFMGALTYIGNGPNFMVKLIAEHAGYRMPSFFGYLLRSTAVLLPILALLTLIFF